MNPNYKFLTFVISIDIIVSSATMAYALSASETPLATTKPKTKTTNDTTIHELSKRQCGDCDDESFNFLYAHNVVRASLGESALGWNSELESHARWWAGQRVGDCGLAHSFPDDGDFKLGENIFWGGGSGCMAYDAVKDWADERRYCSYVVNGCYLCHSMV